MTLLANNLEAERIAFLALGSINGVGHETLKRISQSNTSFLSIIETDDAEEVRKILVRSGLDSGEHSDQLWHQARLRALDVAAKRYRELSEANVSIIFANENDFPQQLFDLKDVPPWLFIQGNVNVLSQPSITVVGSRKASYDGIWLTQYVGHWLAEFGIPSVSGLADGVDHEIHRVSVNANVPTIAFLGTGIFTDYPKGSDYLRRAIIDGGGAIATEYLTNEGYSATNFVRRNRLQAALGKVLIPTEWSLKSGTAHTVRYAKTLNRPIAFLRTPIQSEFNWVPTELSANNGFFTIPTDQNDFVSFLEIKLKQVQKPKVSQLKLL